MRQPFLNWIFPVVVASLLIGCDTAPKNFRVSRVQGQDSQGNQGSIVVLAPGVSMTAQQPPEFTIDVLGVAKQSLSCFWAAYPKARSESGLRASIAGSLGNRYLRVDGSKAFDDQRQLVNAWEEWWKIPEGNNVRKCLENNAYSEVRSALLDRPLRPHEILDRQFGLGGRSRSVILRPGTTVCGSDSSSYKTATGTRIRASAGGICSTIVDDPRGGGVFSATTGRIEGFTTTDRSPSKVYTITSWAEIPKLPDSRHFLLRYPKSMPEDPTSAATDAEFPLIIAVDSTRPEGVELALQCADESNDDVNRFCTESSDDQFKEIPCVKKLSKSSQSETPKRPICFRFGERGVITAQFTIFVNQQAMNIEVGETLGDLLNRVAPPHPSRLAMGAAAAAANGLSRKYLEQTIHDLHLSRWFQGRLVDVDVIAAGADTYALPLLPGDRVAW